VQHPSAADTQALVTRCGPKAQAGTLTQAAAFGEVIVNALPWKAALEALPKLDLSAKVVIDCSNPSGTLPGGAASGGEALAHLAPRAKFAKAFNITGAGNMAKPEYPDGRLDVLLRRRRGSQERGRELDKGYRIRSVRPWTTRERGADGSTSTPLDLARLHRSPE
jgi:hypothetical protein